MSPLIEAHPLLPFLPLQAKVLMLGSFPPPRKRWCMEFYYPNMQNDMWRICGILFRGDKDSFLTEDKRKFDQVKIENFLKDRGIAIYDMATEVVRLRENASDKFLDVVTPTAIASLLSALPACHTLVTTGQKATDLLVEQLGIASPEVGKRVDTLFQGRALSCYRMPSTSRAYPLALTKKALVYGQMFLACGLLDAIPPDLLGE